jgi:hypothetical protein
MELTLEQFNKDMRENGCREYTQEEFDRIEWVKSDGKQGTDISQVEIIGTFWFDFKSNKIIKEL